MPARKEIDLEKVDVSLATPCPTVQASLFSLELKS